MPTANANGVQLHYVEKGRGTPLVLLHGFPLSHRMWSAQIDDLSRDARVIAPDFRGFGQSPDGGAFSIDDLADDVAGLLKTIDAAPAVVAGLSMGGYVAMAVARRHPHVLKGLILVDTRADADGPMAREGRARNIELVRSKGPSAIADGMIPKLLAPGADESRPELAGSLRNMIEACPAITIERALVALRDRPDSTSTLAAVKAPALVIVGDGDQITPPDLARAMQATLPKGELAVIRGAGHMAPMEQPAQVTRALRSFIKSLG
jgi:pimeloyl-ACP methyl ester carboxylesterase